MADAEELDGRQAERLILAIGAIYHGGVETDIVAAAFDEARLLVPTIDGNEIVSAVEGGVRWVSVFTSIRELACFARSAPDDGLRRGYLTVPGATLRRVLSAAPEPTGIAIDPAGTHPWPILPA